MTQHPLIPVLKRDRRYKYEAYEFVRESLAYAQNVMQIEPESEPSDENPEERHLTGQQLCEASREYALEQFGMMARVVLNTWGINSTSDLGEIVYNMIGAKLMKKSPVDRREDFNDVFDFSIAFEDEFEIRPPEKSE